MGTLQAVHATDSTWLYLVQCNMSLVYIAATSSRATYHLLCLYVEGLQAFSTHFTQYCLIILDVEPASSFLLLDQPLLLLSLSCCVAFTGVQFLLMSSFCSSSLDVSVLTLCSISPDASVLSLYSSSATHPLLISSLSLSSADVSVIPATQMALSSAG